MNASTTTPDYDRADCPFTKSKMDSNLLEDDRSYLKTLQVEINDDSGAKTRSKTGSTTTVDVPVKLAFGDSRIAELPRYSGESDNDYARRFRKHNYLNLAQKFVDQKERIKRAVIIENMEKAKNQKNREKTERCLVEDHLTSNNIPVETDSCESNKEELVAIKCPDLSWPAGKCVLRNTTEKSLSSTAFACKSTRPSSFTKCKPATSNLSVHDQTMHLGSKYASGKRSDEKLAKERRHTFHSAYKESDDDHFNVPQLGGIVKSQSQCVNKRLDIETTMPTIDWESVEEHLAKASSDQDAFHKHRHSNREEIRRKLAMGCENEDYYGGERMARKPNLQTRLQSGMNLQICFLNETVTDQRTDVEKHGMHKEVLSTHVAPKQSSSFPGSFTKTVYDASAESVVDSRNFVSKQAKLQAEARLALAQAKQMAHMQMEVEKQRKKKSPIAEMVGIHFANGRRKISRQALSEMNVAQLQVIVNDLHTQIETLNDDLVRMLLERDDLHMEQDSMLVDVEDLTRYVGTMDIAKTEEQQADGKHLVSL